MRRGGRFVAVDDGRFAKDQFDVDLETQTGDRPAATTQHPSFRSGRRAPGGLCAGCPLKAACTKTRDGRACLSTARADAADAADRAGRAAESAVAGRLPLDPARVEREISHFVRRAWGGRKTCRRGAGRILTDVLTRAAVLNPAGCPGMDSSPAPPAGPSPNGQEKAFPDRCHSTHSPSPGTI